MYCQNCKNQLFSADKKIEVCPTCGDILKDMVEQREDVNIELNFTFSDCNCGNILSFDQNICNKCGQPKEVQENGIDPIVRKRQEKFLVVLEFIEQQDNYIKDLRRKIYKGDYPRIYAEDFIAFIQGNTDSINGLLEKNLFKNIVFNNETIDSSEMKDKIIEIKDLIAGVYRSYEEIIRTEVLYIWENAYFRYLKTIEAYLQSTKIIIYTIVSKNLKEARENMTIAQHKLDKASEELKIFSNIINIKKLELNNETFVEGKVNYGLLYTMTFTGSTDFSDINTGYNELNLSTYNYFKEFLINPFEYYCSFEFPLLIKVSPYRFMGMVSYNENSFFEKIKIVTGLLEKADKIDRIKLKESLDMFLKKYIYAHKKLEELIQENALYFSYNVSEAVIIKAALRWYKDLSEGIYKDISSILICCTKIVKKDNLDIEHVIKWMGFPEKFEYLLSQTKLKLHKLTDGVEKDIRHSEAHVDYDILDKEKIIVIRNKRVDNKTKKGIEKELRYTFEEFLIKYTSLSETIFSIFAGIDIFMINNYIDFGGFILEVDKEFQDPTEQKTTEVLFSFLGIINLHIDEIIENDKKILIIKGVSIERKDKEIFQNCKSCATYMISNRQDIDLIFIELIDTDGNIIGSEQVIAKYITRYNGARKQFQKYELLLLLVTSKLDYFLENESIETIDSFGFKFITGILGFCLELTDKLNAAIKLYGKENYNYIIQLEDILEEFNYINNTINEYIILVDDNRLLKHIQNIIDGFTYSISMMIPNKKNNNRPDIIVASSLFQIGCNDIVNIYKTEGNVEKIQKLLNKCNLLITNKKAYIKAGRNDSCPCGSGKKYKKCCGK